MIKGHTKIELTNVKTGQKKVIEDDNLVTNGMAKMFELTPFCQLGSPSNPFRNSAPLIDRLCGGILLFSDPIEEDPDNYMTPSGNTMVGNGRVNYASAQDVPEFGAYNAEESSWNPETGERKYVYDFATSKGNGTISCVTLTNFLTGYYGLGNSSGKSEIMTVENVNYGNTTVCTQYFWGANYSFNSSFDSGSYNVLEPYILFADYNKNCMYVIDRYELQYRSEDAHKHISTGTFSIYKVYFPMSSVNPMGRLGNDFNWKVIGKIDIEVPSVIKSMPTNYSQSCCICRDDDAMYMVFNNTSSYDIQPNATFYVWKISYDLKTSEVYTLTNTTGAVICGTTRSNTDDYSRSLPMFVMNDYLICQNASNSGVRVFKMNLSDPTDVTEFTNLMTNKSSYCYKFYKLGNTLMVHQYSDKYGAVNLQTREILPVNGNPALLNNSYAYTHTHTIIPIYGTGNNFVIVANGEKLQGSYNTVCLNPFRLSTINNLPEPVVKTSDLSMKITYTLTPLGDEEEGDS